jgi:hypothetical protein
MANERAKYFPTWWRIGPSLQYYYEVPTELPPKLITLIKKLDSIEGDYLLRHLRATPEQKSEQSAL